MKQLRITLLTSIVFLGLATVLPNSEVMAQTAQQAQDGVNAIGGGGSPSFGGVLETIVNAFLFIIGALSVVMIVYGGFRYVTSAGDSSAVSAAKNTILYAVVGLVIALSAYAISDFVSGMFNNGPSERIDSPSGPGPAPTPSNTDVPPDCTNGTNC